ncbi:MAG: hypothetical protein AUI83_07755 [Armatimonadetes bacterium 13_1_40CM_3_65_7]|nr:MAG: hypothetical protein AUI83_07755 [Armatimonadetes bacterium 13_1_40CM_3_65_7]
MATQAGTYPLRFDVQYPGKLSRGLIFVKWLLAVPHYLLINVFGNLQSVISLIAFFSILFTERYPRALFDLWVNAARWGARVGAYVGLLRDEYPPFVWDRAPYPITYDVEYPERLSRWLIFVKWLLLVPHYVALLALWVAATAVWVVGWFAILFTEQFPRGMFDFLVGVARWSYRVTAYFYLLRDEYPPFSLT